MKLLPMFVLAPLVGCVEAEAPAPADPTPEAPGDPEAPEPPDLPDAPECQSDAECPSDETCWVNPVALWSRCVPRCETDADCDGDQLCRTMYDARACVDPQAGEDPLPIPVDEDDGLPVAPITIECIGPVDNQVVDLPFSLDADTTSAMVVPFTADGGPMAPIALTVPDGRTFDLRLSGNSFLGVTAGLIGFTSPLFLPQSPVAEVLVQEGDYTFTVAAITEDLCSFVVTERADAGRALDLNLYYVGIDGIDAASAPTDPDVQQTIGALEAIYGEAGVSIGEVRHFDVDAAVADAFSIIDDVNTQPAELVSTSLPPGADDEDLLSVNVFFVAEMADGNVIGISQGIPGPIGLHGTPGSGVVLTAEFLGSRGGNQLTGQILAHELGHWLGLFHTSEIAGGFFDPIADTAQCDNIAQLVQNGTFDQCPDFLNLMFPFANGAANALTADQGSVLLANPVTR